MLPVIFLCVQIVNNEQDRARGNFLVMLQESSQLLDADRFEALLRQITKEIFHLGMRNLVWMVDVAVGDGVEHDWHDHGAWCAMVGIPAIFEILAGVLKIGVGHIHWVEQRCGKGGRQIWRRPNRRGG